MTGRNVGRPIGGKWRWAFQSKRLRAVMLAGTCLSPLVGSVPVRAQDATWQGAAAGLRLDKPD